MKEENAIEILGIIAAWVKTKASGEIEALAEKHGFSASRVYTIQDVVENEHFRQRGFVTEVDDPLIGEYLDYDFPVMMSKTAPRVSRTIRPVGFDNEYLMTHDLGKSEDEIKHLYECGALGKWADMRGRRPPSDWDGRAGLLTAKD